MAGTDEDVLLINVANLSEACSDHIKSKRPALVRKTIMQAYHACEYTYVCICMYVCVCMYVFATYTHTHTYIHIHTYVYTHA